jgi:transposase
MGTGAREIARLLRMSPNTERHYRLALSAAGLLAGSAQELPAMLELKAAVSEHAPPKPAPQQQSSIEEWRDVIVELLKKGLGPRAIFDRLRLQRDDFTGSVQSVKRMVRRLRREEGVKPELVAIAVETEPGEVAQVDFGYVGMLYDSERGMLRRAWAFVMVLGYSRHMAVRVVFDQSTTTWLRVHMECLTELGGCVRTIVPDNLKAAVIRAAFGVDDETALNRSYRELARHLGVMIDPTPVRAPKKKGKVESGVKYVKHNFFRGRDGEDVGVVRVELGRWVREIAGQREHGTTRRRPLEVFELEERAALLPLPATPFEPVEYKRATVHEDCHVFLDRRLYSVPWRLQGRSVWIRATATTVIVEYDDERVATHPRRGHGYRSTVDAHLPEHRVDWRHRSRSYWEQRADRLGIEVGAFVRELFDSDLVLSQLRAVQATVTHLEKFPAERAQATCRRARFYGSYSYGAIKQILRRGLDLEPLPTSLPTPVWADGPPRFARDVRQLALHLEETNECH